MDRHNLPGVTAQDVAEAHQKDLEIQHIYGCRALTYWFDEERQTAFCLIEAPNKEAVSEMHKNAHGLVPHQVIEVNSQIVESFLGRMEDPKILKEDKNVFLNESAFRVILSIHIKYSKKDQILSIQNNSIESQKHYSLLQNKLTQFGGGKLVEDENKNLLCSFSSAKQATLYAMEIRKSLLNEDNYTQNHIKIGISSGSPIENSNDFFGETTNIANNLCFISFHNKIMISTEVADHYHKEGFNINNNSPEIKVLTQQEESFINRLLFKMNASLNTQGFTVDDLAKEIGVSKSQLYRRIVAITQISPNDLVKEFKLSVALQLMNQKNKNISEIAFETGFSSPSYFSKCFKKRYGTIPSIYIETISQ